MTPTKEYCEIPLTQGQVAKVSPSRFDNLSQWKWYALWNPHTRSFYAQRNKLKSEGSAGIIKMHRYILGLEFGDEHQGDHRNHDTLDNTDGNLRVADRYEQAYNKRKNKDSSNPAKCICRREPQGPNQKVKFRVRISVNGRRVHIGYRNSFEEALEELYLPYVAKMHGEFASVAS